MFFRFSFREEKIRLGPQRPRSEEQKIFSQNSIVVASRRPHVRESLATRSRRPFIGA